MALTGTKVPTLTRTAILAAIAVALSPLPIMAAQAKHAALVAHEKPGLSREQSERAMTAAERARAECRARSKDDEVAYSICVAERRGAAYRQEAKNR
ncbi:hypothetical protein KCG44_14135 [Pacificimonas sp. WHA3]|uniref:Uncharacterized protein n=1 Tax=Pacificimonas pallii TaxID=2827236 RepID=A0ABS6SIZ1_9SPHN|nr:hypothetical protein [Pacificimonas pallii]MBV7257921.1 hypothetical protein [Pacificimonas pallii]